MRGKIVNVCLAVVNILLSAIILVYTLLIPRDSNMLTIQEGIVVGYINILLYINIVAVAVADIIQSYNHRNDSVFNIFYLIGVFSVGFIFIKTPFICLFGIITGLVVLIKSLKENLVELNSIVGISISIVLMLGIIVTGGLVYKYSDLGQYIKNKENENELKYNTEYFKYITELEETDTPYINVKKDGKYGYIDDNGNELIPFKYEFATPFVEISAYGKRFQVALVCIDGSTKIILKNERDVLSYKSESKSENYGAKYEELADIYKNTLKQEEPMKYEVEDIKESILKAKAYNDDSDDYTYRYDYNDEYDFIVTESFIENTYELAKKEDLDVRIEIEVKHVDYDKYYLYLYSNKTIPFFDNIDEDSAKYQGWITEYGTKKSLTGNVQILDFFDNRVLLKDWNKKKIYFVDAEDSSLVPVSETYSDIYVCPSGNYIVKTDDYNFKVIDRDFNKVFETEYKVINPRLTAKELYLVTDNVDNVDFNDFGYAKMNWTILNNEGNSIFDNVEQVYDIYYKLPTDDKIPENNYLKFQNKLKELDYHFPGDKFYEDKSSK